MKNKQDIKKEANRLLMIGLLIFLLVFFAASALWLIPQMHSKLNGAQEISGQRDAQRIKAAAEEWLTLQRESGQAVNVQEDSRLDQGDVIQIIALAEGVPAIPEDRVSITVKGIDAPDCYAVVRVEVHAQDE